MEIKNFIKIYDEAIPLNTISNLILFAKESKFQESTIGGNIKDFNIRRTYCLELTNLSNSLSNVHWSNFLFFHFNEKLKQYQKDLKIFNRDNLRIKTINLLKYENTGFYTWHTDHFEENPRTMSCILLLNNDYEGGTLCFRNPDGSGEWEVEVKPNRMIIWPSNFLYPHTVKPVTKGKRYSIVAWAI